MTGQAGGLPWSFEQKVRDFLRPGVRVLSVGGGEYLLALGHPAELVSVADGPGAFPFEDGLFDLAVAYHADLDWGEAARVLKRGGFLVTQQIGGRNRPGRPDYNLENQGPLLEAAGFRLMYSHQAYVPGEVDHRLLHRFILVGKKR